MAKATIITYECEECGSEIVVTPTGETQMSPIYCCGVEVLEVETSPKKAAAPGKKTLKASAKKSVKKVSKKKATTKKKTTAKRKTTKK